VIMNCILSDRIYEAVARMNFIGSKGNQSYFGDNYNQKHGKNFWKSSFVMILMGTLIGTVWFFSGQDL